MALPADSTALFSLREAAVLSRLPEDKVRREVERKVIKPRAVATGSAHRLLFAESEILFFAMLHSLSGAIELSPPVRATACRLLNDWEPVRLSGTRATSTGKQFDTARLKAWATVHRDARFRNKWVACINREWSKSVNPVFTVNWDELLRDVGPRIDLYRAGLKRIREDDDILGGETVFKGTRLAVRHIGGMRARSEPVERIIEDYPDLTSDDIEFARLYVEAHPLVGRPKSSVANS
jgi:uncharacterized protein (DUF433 family)